MATSPCTAAKLMKDETWGAFIRIENRRLDYWSVSILAAINNTIDAREMTTSGSRYL